MWNTHFNYISLYSDFFGDFQGDGSDATFRSNHYSTFYLLFLFNFCVILNLICLLDPRGESEGRFFSMKKPGSLFYNKAQLFSQLINNKPINPNVIYPNYGSCTSSNGLVGICTLSAVCSLHHGTAGGSCTNGGTCCVSKWFLISLICFIWLMHFCFFCHFS